MLTSFCQLPLDRHLERLVNFNFLPTNERRRTNPRWSGKSARRVHRFPILKLDLSGDFTFFPFSTSNVTAKQSRTKKEVPSRERSLNRAKRAVKNVFMPRKDIREFVKAERAISETKTDEMSWRSLEMSFTSCFERYFRFFTLVTFNSASFLLSVFDSDAKNIGANARRVWISQMLMIHF